MLVVAGVKDFKGCVAGEVGATRIAEHVLCAGAERGPVQAILCQGGRLFGRCHRGRLPCRRVLEVVEHIVLVEHHALAVLGVCLLRHRIDCRFEAKPVGVHDVVVHGGGAECSLGGVVGLGGVFRAVPCDGGREGGRGVDVVEGHLVGNLGAVAVVGDVTYSGIAIPADRLRLVGNFQTQGHELGLRQCQVVVGGAAVLAAFHRVGACLLIDIAKVVSDSDTHALSIEPRGVGGLVYGTSFAVRDLFIHHAVSPLYEGIEAHLRQHVVELERHALGCEALVGGVGAHLERIGVLGAVSYEFAEHEVALLGGIGVHGVLHLSHAAARCDAVLVADDMHAVLTRVACRVPGIVGPEGGALVVGRRTVELIVRPEAFGGVGERIGARHLVHLRAYGRTDDALLVVEEVGGVVVFDGLRLCGSSRSCKILQLVPGIWSRVGTIDADAVIHGFLYWCHTLAGIFVVLCARAGELYLQAVDDAAVGARGHLRCHHAGLESDAGARHILQLLRGGLDVVVRAGKHRHSS